MTVTLIWRNSHWQGWLGRGSLITAVSLKTLLGQHETEGSCLSLKEERSSYVNQSEIVKDRAQKLWF